MFTVKTSGIITYIKNHISKDKYENAHRIDVVIPILNNPRIETEFIQDEAESVFCFHDDFWDFDGDKNSKADRDRYLSEYRTATVDDGNGWYRIWWRIKMPLNLNNTVTANGTLYFQDSDGWKVLGTIKNAEMGPIDFDPEAERMILESISEDYLRRFE